MKRSPADNGGNNTKMRLPVIFDWMSDDDEFANAFCNTAIMTSPGTRNAVYVTRPSKTDTRPSSTWEKMSRYKSALKIGAAIVWKLTFQNRSSSLWSNVNQP